jgi:hypothetical protein
MLTTELHQVPRLRMSGAMPLLLLYAFMAGTGITFINIWGVNLNGVKPNERVVKCSEV